MEHLVCRVSELEERKPIAFDIDGQEVGVILSKGELYAYENYCPHFGGPVCLGDVFERIKLKLDENKKAIDEYTDENELNLACPWHAYEFNLQTGICTVDPKLKINKVRAYIKDDNVYVEINQGG